MNLTKTIIASALLSCCALYQAQAAEQLSPEKAEAIKPFDRIVINGRFNTLDDAAAAVSQRADELGASGFYIQSSYSANSNGGNWRVVADIYHSDAPKVSADSHLNTVDGVIQLPKAQAYELEPYDTVTVSGYFSSQPDVLVAIAAAAKEKAAYSFFIVRQINSNSGGNQQVTAFVYKKDAAKRKVQDPDAIPADSQAGKAALAAGGESAKKVEIPGIASSSSPSSAVGRFFETQSSQGKRYTVTLSDGTKIQELSNVTAAQMTPFDSVSFSGHFNSVTEVSEEVAKQAAEKGAKYYHITRQWQNMSGGNLTVSADLFK
jgi:hypothetical protein